MIIKAVIFQRISEKSKWESGISIECNGTADGMIIDSNGNTIKGTIYNVKDKLYDMCLDLTGILNSIKGIEK